MMKELEELRATSNVQKKELEELRARFAVDNKALMEDYQKKIDEMFFFGYQCYMKKNGITQDISHYPSDDKDVTVSGPAQEDKDLDVVGPYNGK